MLRVKNLVIDGVYVALLIGGQLALSGISGVEIVTVLLLSFCYVFGIKNGLFVATAFSIIRCLIFGFNVNVIVLYLIYYNLFALFFGFLGNRLKNSYSVKGHILVVISASLFVVFFTLLDNVITPIFYGFSLSSMKAYAVASLLTLLPHIVFTFVSTTFLFYPILTVVKKI